MTQAELKGHIAMILRQYRFANDEMTQEEIADLCGIDRRTYSNLERRISLPSAMTLFKIKAATGLDLIP